MQWQLQEACANQRVRQLMRAGGSSEEFEEAFRFQGSCFPPMTIEHGVTHNKGHNAFSLEPTRDAQRLGWVEAERLGFPDGDPNGTRRFSQAPRSSASPIAPTNDDLAAFAAAAAAELSEASQ